MSPHPARRAPQPTIGISSLQCCCVLVGGPYWFGLSFRRTTLSSSGKILWPGFRQRGWRSCFNNILELFWANMHEARIEAHIWKDEHCLHYIQSALSQALTNIGKNWPWPVFVQSLLIYCLRNDYSHYLSMPHFVEVWMTMVLTNAFRVNPKPLNLNPKP